MVERERISRRTLLRQGSALAAGAVSGLVLAQGCAAHRQTRAPAQPAAGPSGASNDHAPMAYRRLGKTNLMVSEIVLGGHFNDPRGRPFWDRFTGDLPPDVAQNRAAVVSKCIDYGINYVDITYGSEALAYGAALKGRRDKMYIAADDGEYAMRQERQRNAEGQMRSIESCLDKLETDYLDIWRPQFKHTGGHRDLDMEMCIEVFEKARKQGKARFLGMSTHDRAWAQYVIEKYPQYTVIYAPYTLKSQAQPASLKSLDREQRYEPQDQESRLKDTRKGLLETARKNDVGVITTKPFSAGLIFSATQQEFGRPDRATDADRELARLTLACILTNPDISGVAVGMLLPSYVDNNVRACVERQAASADIASGRLQTAAHRMWTQLPPEYRWLRQWEHV
jgi:aryl-alcohol dehydrogenase-like predicted oxidoreductase